MTTKTDPSTNSVFIRKADWETDENNLLNVRFAVFVDEQKVPPEEEIDSHDPESFHLLALNRNHEPVATGRLTPAGHIGRMAVLKQYRGTGTGGRILEMLLAEARRRGHRTVQLSAQTHAIAFYQKYGFELTENRYLDCGIPHVDMIQNLT